jgi:hypothetical protein
METSKETPSKQHQHAPFTRQFAPWLTHAYLHYSECSVWVYMETSKETPSKQHQHAPFTRQFAP